MGKKLVGVDIGSYVFDASEKTITFSGITGLSSLDQILIITNLTEKIDIYDLDQNLGVLSSNVLTLDYDTTLMSDTDILQIWVWLDTLEGFSITDGVESVNVTSSNQLEVFQEKIKITDGTREVGITTLNEIKTSLTNLITNAIFTKITNGLYSADITESGEIKTKVTNSLESPLFTRISNGVNVIDVTSLNELKVSLVNLITNAIFMKLTDGTTVAGITDNNELKVLSTTTVDKPNYVKISDGVDTANVSSDSKLQTLAKITDDTNTAGITTLNELKVFMQNLISSALFTKITDGTTTAGVTTNNQIKAQVELVDKNGKVIEFTAGGEIPVSNPPPTAPAGTTPTEIAYYSTFTTLDNQYYVIPNGYTLIIQQFEAYGSYDSVKGMRAELWWQPNGSDTGESIITVIGINGMGSSRATGKTKYVGDGTKRLALRTVVEGVGKRTRFIKVIGYLFLT